MNDWKRLRKQADKQIRPEKYWDPQKIEPIDKILDKIQRYAFLSKNNQKICMIPRRYLSHLTPNRDSYSFQILDQSEKLRKSMNKNNQNEAPMQFQLLAQDNELKIDEDILLFKKSKSIRHVLQQLKFSLNFAAYFAHILQNKAKTHVLSLIHI
eukprot:TRINITY_DN15130_c0_g1_i1.p2 TRINITY_DN15130_c0_g1~~TRINITY_DN15130_c0_g1_i1.p2  ORF type:complete len:154 (-),score=3.23 TRINITY_DN15130_c0_g1_i1:98-559(-)